MFDLTYQEEKDKYIFTITANDTHFGEFALVFTKNDKRYTADIFSLTENKTITAAVLKNKIISFEKVCIVDINTDSILFEMPWSKNEEIKTNDEEKDLLLSPKTHSSEEPLLVLSENSENKSLQRSEEAQKGNMGELINKFLDAFSNAVENKSLPAMPFSQDEHFLSFGEVYDSFKGIKIPNHTFYSFDEKSPENANVRVLFGKEYISVQSLFLGYSNGILSNFPDKIVGTASDSLGSSYNVFGILGENKPSHRPFDSLTGYKFFYGIKNSDLGYWLMYLNKDTGAICTENVI